MAQNVTDGKLAIGDRIKAAREETSPRVTIEQLAARLGVSSRTVAGWQSGRSRPSYERLIELAEILGKPASYFLNGDAA